MASNAFLTTINMYINEINNIAGRHIPGVFREYERADSIEKKNENGLRYPQNMLKSLSGS